MVFLKNCKKIVHSSLQEIKTLRKQLLSLSPRGSSDSLDEPSESENRQKGSNLNLAMQDATSMQYKKWKRARLEVFKLG